MIGKKWVGAISFILIIIQVMTIFPGYSEEVPPPGWTYSRRLTELDGNSSLDVKIAVDSHFEMHIVFADHRYGPPELYYMKLDEDGNTVIPEKVITTPDSASSRMGDIAVDSNDNIHVVWDDVRHTGAIPNMEIYYKKLNRFGNTLVDETRITTAPHYSVYPALTVDPTDNIHLTWCEEMDYDMIFQEEIFYAKLDNDGNFLVNPLAVTESDGEESIYPDIEADSQGNIHIVWLDDRNETGTNPCQDYYYSKLSNNGNTLVDDTRIFKFGDHNRPKIVMDPSDMIDLFIGSMPNRRGNIHKQLYRMKLDSNGEPMGEAVRLTNDDENSTKPEAALDSTRNMHLVWEDERDNTEIYYMMFDTGANVLIDELRLTSDSNKSEKPVVAIGKFDVVNAVWADGRAYDDGDRVELYKISSELPVQNFPPTVEISSPVEGQNISGQVEIRGTASDPDGSVAEVQVKIGGSDWYTAQGTNSWSLNWDTKISGNGLYEIRARSSDGIYYSPVYLVNVTVYNDPTNSPPSVNITSPKDGEVSGTITVRGKASDPDGNLERVQVKIDNGGWIAASGTTSWTFPWDTTSEQNGEHFIFARARDDDNELSEVDSVMVIVDNRVNTPPGVDISAPSAETVSGTVDIEGTAWDVDGDTISRVEVNILGDWETASGTTEWSYSWDTTVLDDGEYNVSARSFDGNLYSAVQSITVDVDNPRPPHLTITSETPEKVSGTLIISGTASDVDGNIVRVEVQIDDGEWVEVSGTESWSHEIDTTELSDGLHLIAVRAVDDEDEHYVRLLTIDVDNPDDMPFWVIPLGIIVLLILIVAIALSLRRKPSMKAEMTQPPVQTESSQPVIQNLTCRRCRNVFAADVSKSIVQCPKCGLSGGL